MLVYFGSMGAGYRWFLYRQAMISLFGRWFGYVR